jgi:hypothetical protein
MDDRTQTIVKRDEESHSRVETYFLRRGRAMAYKRGKCWYATGYDHGRRVYVKAGPSKKVAEQIERDLKTKIVKGEYLGIYDEKRVLFRDFIPRYLAYSQANKRPESASRDARSLKAVAESFGDRYLSEITPEPIEAHKERRLESVKPATVNKEFATLKHLYTLAMKWRYVNRNPVREVKLLKEPPGRLRYLLPEQYVRLLHACALHFPDPESHYDLRPTYWDAPGGDPERHLVGC